MTVSPDTSETSAPRDPAEYRPRRFSFSGLFASAAFGVICLLAGLGLARFGPDLFPARPDRGGATAADLAPLDPGSAASGAVAPADAQDMADAPPASLQVEALSRRVEMLEAEQSRLAEAAASALAAAALMEASQTSHPFGEELAALDAISPPSSDLRSLRRLAETGAPSRASLAASFPDFAARAAAAAGVPAQGASIGDRIQNALSRVVTLRRVGDVPGDSVDARLARAERQLGDGDLEAALKTLEALPTVTREAMSVWRTRAERRAEIDRRVASIRAEALEDLGRQARRTP